ncbi:MAG: thiamine phosphate synthase [bacterium]|nr:MAG: thiamine phosphate synthase [bacterium]
MEHVSDDERRVVLRILDANANRCAEGLRVVEEVARFARDAKILTERLKEIRHAVRCGMDGFTGGPYRFRDSGGDVGRDLMTVSENTRESVASVARANFMRAEEALRVIEEFGKLLDPARAREFKHLRFELYTLERDFFGRAQGHAVLPSTPFLYGVLDRSYVSHADAAGVTEAMIEGGVDMLQYRAKGVPTIEQRLDLLAILPVAGRLKVPVIVNDDPALAFETGACGVHLGSSDPSPEDARALLGPGSVIGVSVHNADELSAVPVEIVDYIAVGSIFPSPTKPSVPAIGLSFIERNRAKLACAIVAIGGISASNADDVLDAGADGIAVISAVLRGDVRKNCFTFKEIVARRREERG